MWVDSMEIDEKYSLSIYHFNLQYKAGDKKSYFRLHRDCMHPFLVFYDRHPQWAMSCEIQGHYLKFMQKFFPEDLAIFKKLNQRRQLELISVHYSDQIYLAYPERDMQESININNEIFTELGLKRSGVWFGQENFFGPGIAENIMEKNGFQTALLNRHYMAHHNKAATRKAPYWKFRELDHDRVNYLVSAGQGYHDNSIHLEQGFSYWGDAELAFGATPYASFLARPREQYLKNLWKYKELEKKGFKVCTVEDYIKRVKELKLKPEEGPYLTDGSWNTRYYQGVYLWMGWYRLNWERDAELRSLTYRTRSHLLVIEKLIQWAAEKNHPNILLLQYWMKLAWKHLLLAEVSDSTGQQPFIIEIYYTEAECKACERYLTKIIHEVKSFYQLPQFFINVENSTQCEFSHEICMHEDFDVKVKPELIRRFFPHPIELLRINKSKTKYTIHRVNDTFGADDRHYILDISLKPRSITPFWKRIMAFMRDGGKMPHFSEIYDNNLGNYTGILFPLWENKVIYSPACLENKLHQYDQKEFDFTRTWLPLPNGLIGLGKDYYIIKHNNFGDTHIACTLNFNSKPSSAGFLLLNPPMGREFHWRFSIFQGTQSEALDIANKINVFPTKKI